MSTPGGAASSPPDANPGRCLDKSLIHNRFRLAHRVPGAESGGRVLPAAGGEDPIRPFIFREEP